MKMAVIGSRGFLGSRIASCFKGQYQLLTPTHDELDITNRDSVWWYLENTRPDVIMQCAAVSDVGTCDREPERTWRINVDGSVNIAEIGGSLGAKCILCSSDQVYFGSQLRTPHVEEEQLVPCNAYGRQKLAMEQQCLQLNPEAVLLRLSWMYDKRQRLEGEHGNFLVSLLSNLRSGADLCFPIHDRRGITNVAEVVENLKKAIDLPGGVYNFGSTNDRSTYETMKAVFSEVNQAGLLRMYPNSQAFQENPRNLCMKTDKIETFGIRFSTTVYGLLAALKEESF